MKKINLLLGAILMMTLFTGCNSQTDKSVATIITLDINPSIELHLNSDDKVVGMKAGNDDAKKVLEGKDFEDDSIDTTLNQVVTSLVDQGYLNTENNTVLLSVDNDDDQKRTALEKQLGETIQSSMKEYSIDGAIFSQDLDIDDDIEELIKKYDISYGKATLIEAILDLSDDNQKDYLIEDLVKLNAQDLIMIYQALEKTDDDKVIIGSVSTSKYITSESALLTALTDANLTQDQITDLEIDYDVENGVLTYEVEFKSGGKEYEYEISAVAGVIEREIENDDSNYVANPPAVNNPSPSTNGTTNYDDSNYGTTDDASNYGTSSNTNYDEIDYGVSNPGTSNYNDNSNYGTSSNTNYDDTDYGANSSEASDYDDSSNYANNSTTDYDDGDDSGYDDDDSSYDDSDYN